jgi:hypothetical protein
LSLCRPLHKNKSESEKKSKKTMAAGGTGGRGQLIKINSADRIFPTDASHSFTIESKWLVLEGTYALEAALMPVSAYTISNNNNTINFNENSTNKQGVVANGYYTTSTLPSAIATALTTASGGYATYTCTFDTALTQNVTIASTHSFSLLFGSEGGAANNSIAPTIGFAAADTTPATSVTGTGVYNLSPALSFNVVLDQAAEICTPGGNTMSFTIPVTTNSGGWVYFCPSEYARQSVTFRQPVRRLQIKVVNDSNQLVNLNNVDFYLLLRKQYS